MSPRKLARRACLVLATCLLASSHTFGQSPLDNRRSGVAQPVTVLNRTQTPAKKNGRPRDDKQFRSGVEIGQPLLPVSTHESDIDIEGVAPPANRSSLISGSLKPPPAIGRPNASATTGNTEVTSSIDGEKETSDLSGVVTDTAPGALAAKSATATRLKIPVSATTLNNSAVALSREGRHEEAVEMLRKAVEAAPESYKLYRNLSIVYESMNRMDEAVVSARTAVALAPRERSTLTQLCGLEVLTGRNAEAVACYRRLEALGPMDGFVQTYYGVAALRAGDLDTAVRILEKAVAAEPSTAALNALGVCYHNQRRFTEAIKNFKRAVELDPEKSPIRYNLAVTQLAMRNRVGALSQYNLLKEYNQKLAKKLYRMLFSDKIIYVGDLKQ